MSERIETLRKRREKSGDIAKIHWGFCIPDCARCCHGDGKELTQDEAAIISMNLDVPQEDFVSLNSAGGRYPELRGPGKPGERIRLRTFADKCVFLCTDSTCLVYDYKPSVCTRYGNWLSDCKDYRRIRELHEKGLNIKGTLMAKWLAERKTSGYDRVKWKVTAELLVEGLLVDGGGAQESGGGNK